MTSNALDHYQEKAYEFAVYKSKHYPYLALAEEAGEVAALAAKSLRKYGDLSAVDRWKLSKELGDVLWQLCAIATDNQLLLSDIADDNIVKLTNRKINGEICER